MVRLILLVLLVLFALMVGIAVVLYHFFGWKGMIALPIVALAVAWVAKILIGKAIKAFALKLFAMKAKALRGATMTVHSITPVPQPTSETSPNNDDTLAEAEKVATPALEDGSQSESDSEEDEKEDEDEQEEPQNYYSVDLTITPALTTDERVWEPGELMLTSEQVKSLEDLDQKSIGNAHNIRIWDGSKFGPDDPGKYPGSQRLKVTFSVKRGVSKACLQYYNESLGSLDFPAWEPKPDEQPKASI